MATYRGTRSEVGCLVTADGMPLAPRNDLRNHSPDGFEWNYAGSGPAQLALALLAHHFNRQGDHRELADKKALALYHELKFTLIAGLAKDGWQLDSHVIEDTVELAVKSEARHWFNEAFTKRSSLALAMGMNFCAPLGVICGILKPAQEVELPVGTAPDWRDLTSIHKTLKYRLYGNRRNKHLHQTIDCAGIAWNHITTLQRRYYRLTGRYAHKYTMTKHMAKLRRRGGSNAYLRKLGSQALQDVCLRHDKTYQTFFKWVKTREGRRKGPPGFKKVKTYTSFTLTQAGWKFLGENRIRLGEYNYKFSKSREVQDKVKTVTIKRDKLGCLWVCFSVIQQADFSAGKTGEVAGFDFGLKDFLTDHTGKTYHHPQPFKEALKDIARLNRQLARKQTGSHGRLDAKRHLNKAYERVTNVRRAYFWKLGNDLTDRYDVLHFEDLNLEAMKRLWGRKVSDLAFGEFLHIVRHLCHVKGKTFEQIDRWNPSSQTHFECGHRQKLNPRERVWTCQGCGEEVQRDWNAAKNICAGGASPASLDAVRRAAPAGVA